MSDLSDNLLFVLLQWFEMTGESGRWVEVHQEITRRLHLRDAPTASRNTPAPSSSTDATEESSCLSGRKPPSGSNRHPGN